MFNWIISFFSRQPNLAKLKIVTFPILIGGLSIDYALGYNFVSKQFSVTTGTDEILIPILMVGIFIIMLIANLWDKERDRKITERKLDLLESNNVSNRTKRNISETL